MGQKTNPIANRLGIIRGWESNWYGGKDFGDKLAGDSKIRKYLKVRLGKASVSKIAILALAIVFAAGLFVVGFDQGHIFSLVYGEQAFVDMTIHELTHDMRHAAGFPCH